MGENRRSELPSGAALALAMIFAAVVIGGEEPQSQGAVVELKGRVAQTPGQTNLTFRTEEGPVYQLKRDSMSEALYADTNLHSKVLLLKGRVIPDKNTFQVTGNLHSIKDGKRHELFYYCDICAITTSIPGLCLCCREPVELREEPVG